MNTEMFSISTPCSRVPLPASSSSSRQDDGVGHDARAVRRVLESIGLEPPSETLIAAAGAALWLRFDPRAAPPRLEGLHPDRLLRMFFALDIWAMRAHFLAPDLIEFLRAHARPELPIVIDLGAANARRAGMSPGYLVITGVDATGEEERIIGFGADGEAGCWPAARIATAARARRHDVPGGAVTLYQPLGRRLEIDPRRIVRHGLRRVVSQMRQSIVDFGTTGLAVFDALRQTAAVGVSPSATTPADLGRAAFGDVLSLAADVLARPGLSTTASRFAESAEAWRQVCGAPAGRLQAALLTLLERLERRAIDEIDAASAVVPQVAVSPSAESRPSESRPSEPTVELSLPPRLDDYVHRRGVHCASMALHNLAYHYMGRKWSESLCFGLAAGLNFTYLREPGSPIFLLMGRGSDMEEHFADAVGAHLETFRSDDDERAFDHLLQQLDAGRLVVLEADMFHLPYMVRSLGLIDGLHFGGHKLFVTGHDAAAAAVTVYDYAWKEPITLPVAQLRAARGSRDGSEPPRNGCFVFHFPDEPTPLGEAIPRALRTLVQQMRRPFMQWNGLAAVDRFCRQVARWARLMEPSELQLNLRLAAFMFERAGTGGGNFRNLYHRFMRQAAETLDAPELAAVAGCYRRLAGAWRQVAAWLDEAAEDPARGIFDPARRAQVLLDDIRRLERQAIDDIDDFLQRREAQ